APNDPDYITVLPEVRSQLVVLVRRAGQVLGVLSLESTDPAGFTAEHVDFIEHLAEHAAIAVDNARRYERERRQNEALTRQAVELGAILRIGNALQGDLSLDEVLTQVAEGVRTSLGFNIAVVSLVGDGPARTFRRVAAAGLAPDVWEQLKARSSTYEEGLSLMDPRFQISQSYFISHDQNTMTHLKSYHRPDLESRGPGEWHPDDMLMVPLRGKGGQLIGALSVDDPVDRQLPSLSTVETLEIFANQAAIAIEDARLFEEQRRRLRDLALLQDLGVGFAATLDPMDLLNEVARAAVMLFEVRASTVVLLQDPANPHAATGAVACEPGAAGVLVVTPYPMERLSALIMQIVASGGPLVVPDTAVGLGPVRGLYAAGIRSVVGTPLRAGQRIHGVLFLLDAQPRSFQAHEQQLLQIFATQAAVAVQNARLFDEEMYRLRAMTSLQEGGLRLTATLDTPTLLEEAVRLVIQLLGADSSGVLLVDPAGSTVINIRCWYRGGDVYETARYPSPIRAGGLTEMVLRSGQAIIVGDTETDERINPVTRQEGIRSLLAVPIRVTDQSLGVLFVNSYDPHRFAAHEQQVLQVFANQVAVAIQNARLFEERTVYEARIVAENTRMARELVTARATQRQLLPLMPQSIAGLHMHGVCLPAMEVGGDYYDAVPLSDGRLALALGDVTGKGTSAVMLMAMIKTALLAQVSADPAPLAVIAALNTLAVEYMQGQMMTFFYALYDPATRMLAYGNAGHPYPYVRRADGRLDSLEDGGFPLGAGPVLELTAGQTTLRAGDLLVLFSDGIIEAANARRELFSFDRLERLLRDVDPTADPRLLVEDLVDRVHNFAEGAPQDDVTLLVARVEPD
ncbi:MAG TPA: GAF domain-containing protein, partial [Chloroflexia bacterium]|nr:GAF domain-containing protein [Chloroflexia bacterium]